jgi:hypothetical protein
MSRTKAKELADPRTAKSGCTRACCDKDPKKVPHWKVWSFSRANPGVSPWR